MRFFYYVSDARLIEATVFVIADGPTDGVRKQPDSFFMSVDDLPQATGPFQVVDENAVVYQCFANQFVHQNGHSGVSGLIMNKLFAHDRDAMLNLIARTVAGKTKK